MKENRHYYEIKYFDSKDKCYKIEQYNNKGDAEEIAAQRYAWNYPYGEVYLSECTAQEIKSYKCWEDEKL